MERRYDERARIHAVWNQCKRQYPAPWNSGFDVCGAPRYGDEFLYQNELYWWFKGHSEHAPAATPPQSQAMGDYTNQMTSQGR